MLIAALKEPVEVQFVRAETQALHVFLTVVGPLLIASAAVVAAIVAAKTANKRQQEQLAHDLDVRREEDVRNILDVAVEQVHEITKLVTRCELEVLDAEKTRSKLEEGELSGDQTSEVEIKLREEVAAARQLSIESLQANIEMVAIGIRLKLRLGASHPITEMHTALQSGWEEQIELLTPGLHDNRSSKELEAAAAKDKEVETAYSGFHKTCEAWIRSREQAP